MLAEQFITTCRKDTPALTLLQIEELLGELPAWEIGDDGGLLFLMHRYAFRNFADALQFSNAVGALADAADHHPQLIVEWGGLTVRWWTHVIGGLHRNDFIMAARCDRAYQQHVAGALA
jgi:4a-hydroxytetrahydrobiopterin dehydratase